MLVRFIPHHYSFHASTGALADQPDLETASPPLSAQRASPILPGRTCLGHCCWIDRVALLGLHHHRRWISLHSFWFHFTFALIGSYWHFTVNPGILRFGLFWKSGELLPLREPCYQPQRFTVVAEQLPFSLQLVITHSNSAESLVHAQLAFLLEHWVCLVDWSRQHFRLGFPALGLSLCTFLYCLVHADPSRAGQWRRGGPAANCSVSSKGTTRDTKAFLIQNSDSNNAGRR